MLRLSAAVVLVSTLGMPAFAQVTKQGDDLQEQLVADSLKITGSAVAQKVAGWRWETSVNYSITNNSGMNLYLGFLVESAVIGSCTDVEGATGALRLLPPPGAVAYSVSMGQGEPRGAFVPTGGRANGTKCSAVVPSIARA